MKNTVNYRKHFSKGGTVYDQTIKINFNLAWEFNDYIRKIKEETEKKSILNSTDIKILDYLEYISYFTPNFTTLTTLDYFIKFYSEKNKDFYKDDFFKRIKWRNTCFEVIPNA